MRLLRVVLLVVLLVALAACSGDDTPVAITTTTTTTTTAVEERGAVVLIAGDVALCQRPEDEATADVVVEALKAQQRRDAVVAVAGDLAYDRGTAKEFAECYGPSWGRFKDRTRPAPGNHEYGTPGAAGYFDYFGDRAGEKGKGWYSYDVGAWHVVVVNSNCAAEGVGGCGPASEQGRWLAADLAAHGLRCTLAYWHHPRWSSGHHGSDVGMDPLWQAVVAAGVDVVVNGHDHHYERFAPVGGTRQFVVGTGGAWSYPVERAESGSEVRHSGTPGVLQLTLHEQSYDWKFLSVPGARPFTDEGTSACG